jgi:hypothetical protein
MSQMYVSFRKRNPIEVIVAIFFYATFLFFPVFMGCASLYYTVLDQKFTTGNLVLIFGFLVGPIIFLFILNRITLNHRNRAEKFAQDLKLMVHFEPATIPWVTSQDPFFYGSIDRLDINIFESSTVHGKLKSYFITSCIYLGPKFESTYLDLLQPEHFSKLKSYLTGFQNQAALESVDQFCIHNRPSFKEFKISQGWLVIKKPGNVQINDKLVGAFKDFFNQHLEIAKVITRSE